MISDFYPKHERNGAYSIYFLAIPLGAGIGFGLGSTIATRYGWRMAFVVLGIPGIIVSFLILRMNNPKRGINDEFENQVTVQQSDKQPITHSESWTGSEKVEKKNESRYFEDIIADLKILLSNPHYMTSTAGMICVNFALGGLADWYT